MTDHSDLIEELRALSAYPGDAYDRAASALSSQSLSLSEARGEIERLRRERDDYRERWKSSSKNVARVCGTMNRLRDQRDEAAAALRPFADFAQYFDSAHIIDDHVFIRCGQGSLIVGDLRRARALVSGSREDLRNPAYDGPMGIFEGYGDEP